MTLSQLPIFAGTPEPECIRMTECFRGISRSFSQGETAYTYGETGSLGILEQGQASLVKIDASGGRTVLERLYGGEIFGELVAFSATPWDSVSLECDTACRILLLPASKLSSPCQKNCDCHKVLLENLFFLLSKKAVSLGERVEILSCRSIREKLLACFRILAGKAESEKFSLPFSLTALADYLCCDRSAMMREIKKLREEKLLSLENGFVVLSSRLLPGNSNKRDIT